MHFGINLDRSLGLSFSEQRELAQEAVRLGYESVWTPAGLGADPFQTCAQWAAAAEAAGGQLTTGISVIPVALWTAPSLAAAAGTLAELTDGRFILGLGTGSIYSAEYRQRWNLPAHPPVAMMRDYLVVVRRLLENEPVSYEGKVLTLRGAQLGFQPPRVPLFLAALGPQMLHLAGALADGVALNWCTPEQIAWSRTHIAEGARRAGRDPAAVQVLQSVRVCIDDDEDAARRAFTRHLLGYALARPGAAKTAGYRGHFGRMGFDAALSELEERQARGAPLAELVEAFPRALLHRLGYFGPARGAAAALRPHFEGLDLAIVRVVPARPGRPSVEAVLQACSRR